MSGDGNAAERGFARSPRPARPRRRTTRRRGARRVAIDVVGHDVREDRKLISPALHVLVADAGVGEFVRERQSRGAALVGKLDRHAGTPGRNRIAVHVAVREDDPVGRLHVEHLAGDLRAFRIPDVDPAARAGVDGRSGAPPAGPERGVREIAEHGFARRVDDDGAVEAMVESGHVDPHLLRLRFARRLARGPRRVRSSSTSSLRRQSASFHISSSMLATGPSASRCAR